MSSTLFENSARFFAAPTKGRRILASFSYLHRIRKSPTTSVWFPDPLTREDRVTWAAVRHFDLLQEADNIYTYDMDVNDLKYTMENILKMRAGGYRITVITLGEYTHESDTDDLALLDQKLQQEITQLIHFLYASELSETATAPHKESLRDGSWSLAQNLDHVAVALHSKRLFKPEKETLRETIFFRILDALSSRHILHETAVGLQVPDANKTYNQPYVAKRENQLWVFQQTMTSFFENLDKERCPMHHMRGTGDHMIQTYHAHQQQALQMLVR